MSHRIKNYELALSHLLSVFHTLSSLPPDECLSAITQVLQREFNCEAACILLWYEEEQKLITKYSAGLPPNLGPEKYGPNQGLTGKYIFSREKGGRYLIDSHARKIRDSETGRIISDSTINWQYIRKFKEQSFFADFKSLLGAPFFIKNQKLGVVKLINKKEGSSDELVANGFSEVDKSLLDYFLRTIQYVVEAKRNEEQISALLKVSQKNANVVSRNSEVLKDIVKSCAKSLNYRICLVRLLNNGKLQIKANSAGAKIEDKYVQKCDPSFLALNERVSLAWKSSVNSKSSALSPKSFDGSRKYKLPSASERALKIIRKYKLRSFLIVPIQLRDKPIGTIECYTSLPHNFSDQELNTVNTYANFLATALINDKQKNLLNSLIELQSIETISENTATEEQLIEKLLSHVRDTLAEDLISHAIIFSRRRLTSTKLSCELLYGIEQGGLSSILRKSEYARVLEMLGESGSHEPLASFWDQSESYSLKMSSGKEICVHRAPLAFKSAVPIGTLILSTQKTNDADPIAQQVADLSAKHLGAALANIDTLKNYEGLVRIIDDASSREASEGLSDYILEQTINFFGFDYGAISSVDYIRERVQTVATKSSKLELVDPDKWKHLSDYSFRSKDILVDVVKRKKSVIIDGQEVKRQWDKRLNKMIFDRFHHEDLIRIYVPFIFQSNVQSGQAKDHVLGVIEAGFHSSTQRSISESLRKSFELFVMSCANSLQRATLLEEKKSADLILEKLISIEDPHELLERLLEESVKLVKGDSGDITFLTHYDEKLRLLDPPTLYNVPDGKRRQLIAELDLRAKDKKSIIAHAATSKKFYWSPDVKKDGKYLEEFAEVESELAVPLLYSGKVIGVLNINSNNKDRFNDTKGNLVQSIANRVTILYQKARVTDPLKLISPFNVFSKVEDIYNKIIEVIEDFLKTDAVSIWEKVKSGKGDFKLEMIRASRGFYEKYKEARISTLRSDGSFTANAVIKNRVVQVSEREIKSNRFAFSDFAVKNNLRSMTSVPIRVGQEVYAVIDVFSHRATKLFPEEVAFLKLIASKAALAIQGAKLIQSFNRIPQALLEEDIERGLQAIADSALAVLHADPVILYRYEADQKKFLFPPIVSGTFLGGNIRDVDLRARTEMKEDDLANLIRNHGTQYIKDKKAFLNLTKKAGRTWYPNNFKQQFWEREEIESFAALRLEHGDEVVGVMFVNFRSEQDFKASSRLIEAFAGQAALAIVNAKLVEKNKEFEELKSQVLMAFSARDAIADLAHDSKNLLEPILLDYINFTAQVKKARGETVDKELCSEFIDNIQRPFKKLSTNLKQLQDYRKFNKFKKERCNVEGLIDSSLQILRRKLEHITVRKSYAKTPNILCDKSQIQGAFLNLLINSSEAIKQKGEKIISIKTSVDEEANNVRVSITDNGCGIPKKDRHKVFDRHFTTKKGKTGGLGLSISRFMIQSHGGSIELIPNEGNEGTTFSIVLPIERGNTNDSKNSLRRRRKNAQ
jgi:signal transduction histidine kinase/putative methionine-R-sulfoxide reductase with GAF domain